MNSNKIWERFGQQIIKLLEQKGLPKRVKYLLRDGPAHEAWREVFTYLRYMEISRLVLAGTRVENTDTVLELATTRATIETLSLQADFLRLLGS